VAFERNLARLGRRHAQLADRVAKVDAGAVAIERGPSGVTTLVERGLRLASAYDPASEGRRLAETALADRPDLLIAVGLGLGHQVEAFRAARPAPILVYEPSLARWRALLAVRDDLAWLDAPEVDCAADLDDLGARFQERYAAGLVVRTCVQPVVARLDPVRVREALDRVAHTKRALDSLAATRVTMMRTWSEIAVDNVPYLLATPGLARLAGAFTGVPAVVVAAGPSLDRQLPALAREAERVLVVAIGQTYRALLRAGIRPDLVHAIESKNVSHQIAPSDPDDLALVVHPAAHPSLFEVPARARFVASPQPYQMACWIARALGDEVFLPGGATVAQSAVHLAVALGASEIALVGQDLAFTGGRVYASGSAYDMVSIERTEGGRFAFTNLAEKKALLGIEAPAHERRTDDLVFVEGWDGEPVATSRSYAVFLEAYRGIAAHLRTRGVALVNCTEGGARIPGLEHRRFESWLGEHAREAVHGRARIDRAFAAHAPADPAALASPIAAARDALDRLERASRRGLRSAARARGARGGQRAAARRIDVLRALAKATDAVAEELALLPWLDDLTQAALHELAVATRRVEERAGAEAAFDESTALLRAAAAAVEGGRALLQRLERRLATPVES